MKCVTNLKWIDAHDPFRMHAVVYRSIERSFYFRVLGPKGRLQGRAHVIVHGDSSPSLSHLEFDSSQTRL